MYNLRTMSVECTTRELRENPNLLNGGTCVSPSFVVSLEPNPSLPALFLAGHSSGVVALHCCGRATPLTTHEVTSPGDLLSVLWAPLKPAAFFVVCRSGIVYEFDVCTNDSGPVAVHQLRCQSALTTARMSAKVWSRGAGASTLVTGACDGTVMYHLLKPHFSDEGDSQAGLDAIKHKFGAHVFG